MVQEQPTPRDISIPRDTSIPVSPVPSQLQAKSPTQLITEGQIATQTAQLEARMSELKAEQEQYQQNVATLEPLVTADGKYDLSKITDTQWADPTFKLAVKDLFPDTDVDAYLSKLAQLKPYATTENSYDLNAIPPDKWADESFQDAIRDLLPDVDVSNYADYSKLVWELRNPDGSWDLSKITPEQMNNWDFQSAIKAYMGPDTFTNIEQYQKNVRTVSEIPNIRKNADGTFDMSNLTQQDLENPSLQQAISSLFGQDSLNSAIERAKYIYLMRDYKTDKGYNLAAINPENLENDELRKALKILFPNSEVSQALVLADSPIEDIISAVQEKINAGTNWEPVIDPSTGNTIGWEWNPGGLILGQLYADAFSYKIPGAEEKFNALVEWLNQENAAGRIPQPTTPAPSLETDYERIEAGRAETAQRVLGTGEKVPEQWYQSLTPEQQAVVFDLGTEKAIEQITSQIVANKEISANLPSKMQGKILVNEDEYGKLVGQSMREARIPPSALPESERIKLSQYFEVKGLPLQEYLDKKLALINQGLSREEATIEMKMYYPIITATEYAKLDEETLAELGAIIKPTIGEQVRIMAGISPEDTVPTGTQAAKLFGFGAMQVPLAVLPGLATTIYWKNMSPAERAISLSFDALIVLPMAGSISRITKSVATGAIKFIKPEIEVTRTAELVAKSIENEMRATATDLSRVAGEPVSDAWTNMTNKQNKLIELLAKKNELETSRLGATTEKLGILRLEESKTLKKLMDYYKYYDKLSIEKGISQAELSIAEKDLAKLQEIYDQAFTKLEKAKSPFIGATEEDLRSLDNSIEVAKKELKNSAENMVRTFKEQPGWEPASLITERQVIPISELTSSSTPKKLIQYEEDFTRAIISDSSLSPETKKIFEDILERRKALYNIDNLPDDIVRETESIFSDIRNTYLTKEAQGLISQLEKEIKVLNDYLGKYSAEESSYLGKAAAEEITKSAKQALSETITKKQSELIALKFGSLEDLGNEYNRIRKEIEVLRTARDVESPNGAEYSRYTREIARLQEELAPISEKYRWALRDMERWGEPGLESGRAVGIRERAPTTGGGMTTPKIKSPLPSIAQFSLAKALFNAVQRLKISTNPAEVMPEEIFPQIVKEIPEIKPDEFIKLNEVVETALNNAVENKNQGMTEIEIQNALQADLQQLTNLQDLTNSEVSNEAQAEIQNQLESLTKVMTKVAIRERTRLEEPIKMPKKPILLSSLEQFVQLSPKQKEGSVAWKQGFMYKLIYPPYGEENIINSRTPFPGIHTHTGVKSAFETLIKIAEGALPPTIGRDMGIMRIEISTTRSGEPQMRFTEKRALVVSAKSRKKAERATMQSDIPELTRYRNIIQ